MKEKLILSPTILELNSESNDIYMILQMVILTSNVNLNNARFTEDFINGVVDNQDIYQGIPLVVNRIKLENDVFDSLSHEFDGVDLKTDVIGSFSSFEKKVNDDGSFSLLGTAKVYKRFVKTCEAIIRLYNEDLLKFSCEVLVSTYNLLPDDNIREIPYANGENKLIAHCLVSSPAEINCKPTLLVASLEEDLNISSEGGNILENENQVVFNFEKEIKFYIENNELSFDEISQKLWILLNPDKNEEGYTIYNYYIVEVYNDYFIACEYDGNKYFSIDYIISDNEVVIDLSSAKEVKSEWIPVQEDFEEEGKSEELMDEIIVRDNKIGELEDTIEVLKSEIATKDEALKLSETEANEKIIRLGDVVEELKTQVSSLQPVKEEYERMQEEIKERELSEKRVSLKNYALNSKVITSEEIEENEEIKTMIFNVDEVSIKALIADKIVEKASLEISTPNEDVVISVSKEGDLIPQTRKDKLYGSK